MQEILQRCRWDFVIRSFKAVKSNHDRELTMERFQKRRYVPLSNLTDSKKWVCSGQQSNSFKNTQNIKSIVKIHKYSKIHRKEQDRSLSKTKHNQVDSLDVFQYLSNNKNNTKIQTQAVAYPYSDIYLLFLRLCRK